MLEFEGLGACSAGGKVRFFSRVGGGVLCAEHLLSIQHNTDTRTHAAPAWNSSAYAGVPRSTADWRSSFVQGKEFLSDVAQSHIRKARAQLLAK